MPRACALQQERPPHWRPHALQWGPSTAKNKDFFKKERCFGSCKIKRKVQRFPPHLLPPSKQSFPQYQHLLQSGPLVTTDELAGHKVSTLNPQFTLRFHLGFVHSVGLHKHVPLLHWVGQKGHSGFLLYPTNFLANPIVSTALIILSALPIHLCSPPLIPKQPLICSLSP